MYKPVFCRVFQENTTRVTDRFGQLMVGFRLVLIAAKSAYKLHHVRPIASMHERGFHWTDYCEIWYRALLRKSVEKIQIGLISERNIGHLRFHGNAFITHCIDSGTCTSTIQREPLLRFHCYLLHRHTTQCCVTHALFLVTVRI